MIRYVYHLFFFSKCIIKCLPMKYKFTFIFMFFYDFLVIIPYYKNVNYCWFILKIKHIEIQSLKYPYFIQFQKTTDNNTQIINLKTREKTSKKHTKLFYIKISQKLIKKPIKIKPKQYFWIHFQNLKLYILSFL